MKSLRLGYYVAFLLACGAARAGEPAVAGYADYATMTSQLRDLTDKHAALVSLRSLGTTIGHRNLWVLEIGPSGRQTRPAVLVVGNLHPPHLLGSHLAVGLARQLVERAGHDAKVRELLERVTFYVVPRPAPDASEAFFQRPYAEQTRNLRPMDDDHDGQTDEDGPLDLDGNGWITLLRVEDPAGRWRAHPDDPRVLVESKPAEETRGRWRLHTEGRDQDGDEAIAEDPRGGVELNRNFPFRYPQYEVGAGPNAVSEVESRALADFAYDHPNIAAVFTFTLDDNLMTPWKVDAQADAQPIKTAVAGDDAPLLEHLGEVYQKLLGAKDPPSPPTARGSFSQWAYFQFGRWSLGARAWWIPGAESDDKKAAEPPADKGAKKPADRAGADRGKDDLGALAWFSRQKIDGFVPWKKIDHPDFPGKTVEVGGFKPFVRLNPPVGELVGLTDKHYQFVVRLAESLPRLVIDEAKTTHLGNKTWRIAVKVRNEGYLPTMSRMGKVVEQVPPIQLVVDLPPGSKLLTGSPRTELPPLAGKGGTAEHAWLVLFANEPSEVRVRAYSAAVGSVARQVRLEAASPRKEQQR